MAKAYQLTLRIDMENAAFDEDRAAETARILRRLADRIESGGGDYCPLFNNKERAEGWLFDHNGNSVGEWKASERRYRN
jgi:hypothetical protein